MSSNATTTRRVPGRSFSSDTITVRPRIQRSRSEDLSADPRRGDLTVLAQHVQSQPQEQPLVSSIQSRRRRRRHSRNDISSLSPAYSAVARRSLLFLGLLIVLLLAEHVRNNSQNSNKTTPDPSRRNLRMHNNDKNPKTIQESSSSHATTRPTEVYKQNQTPQVPAKKEPTPQQAKTTNPKKKNKPHLTETQLQQLMAAAVQNGLRDDQLHEQGILTEADDEYPVQDLDLLNGIKDIAATPTHISNNKPKRPKEDSDKLRQYKALFDQEIRDGTRFDYTQEAHAGASTLPLPQRQEEPTSSTLAALVLSTRTNFEQRKAIRESWAKGHNVYFVIGGKSSNDKDVSIQRRLEEELAQHQDLIDVIHPDGYASLPYKLHKGFEYIVGHQPHVQWIVKLDDDMVARLDTLQRAVLQQLNPRVPMVIGRIDGHETNQVFRPGSHHHAKWAEYLYDYQTYPTFPLGSYGYVVSRAVAEQVTQHLEHSPIVYYQGEDTSLGIWLSEANHNNVQWIPTRYFDNHGGCGKRTPWIIAGHGLSPEAIRKCTKELDEWPAAWVDQVLQQSSQRIWGGGRATKQTLT